MPEVTLQYLKSDDLKTQLYNKSIDNDRRDNHAKNVREAAVKLLDLYHTDLTNLKGDVKKSLDKNQDGRIDEYQQLADQISSEIKFASEFDFRDDVINSVKTRILAANEKVVDIYDVAASHAALTTVIDPQKSNTFKYVDGVYTFTAAANQPKITDVIKSTKLANTKSLELDYTGCTSPEIKKKMAPYENNGKVRIAE